MGEKEAFAGVAPAKDSFGTACIRNSEVQRRNKSNYGDSALRLRSGQNDEQKQTKANTEILASPE
jgi:hypothetical protein